MKFLQQSDRFGICISIVCMVHCIAIPVLILLGFNGILQSIDQEWVEWMILSFALLVGFYSFTRGFISHRQHHIPVLFIAGFLLLINGEMILNEVISLGLSIVGALIISYAHTQNIKWSKHAYTH